MARSAKDLRDLINVSRLSMNHSSDEFSSDDVDISTTSTDDQLAMYLTERPSSALSESSFTTISILTRPGSSRGHPDSHSSTLDRYRPSTAPLQLNKRLKDTQPILSGRKTVPFDSKNINVFPSKYTPIPPINKTDVNNNATKCKENTKEIKTEKQRNFDSLCQYLDSTIINKWLEDLNKKLIYLQNFMSEGNNFAEFANFFLASLPVSKYIELIDLEFSIIMDQLQYAFHAGFNESSINNKDIVSLLNVVLKEYPKQLKKSQKGPKLLLNIVLVFCSEKDDKFRKLLRNINCYTENKLYIQWLLAIRAFGLISFVMGILSFYENILKMQSVFAQTNSTVDSSSRSLQLEVVAIGSVKNNFIEVLDFLLTNTEVCLSSIRDNKNRNLFFIAVTERNIELIDFFAKLHLDINHKAENGSSPLIYAVNRSDYEIAEVLLNLSVDVNVWNEHCEGATPLHSAVMLGDAKMVELLLRFGADKDACMGVPAVMKPLSIAKEMQHDEIIKMLSQ